MIKRRRSVKNKYCPEMCEAVKTLLADGASKKSASAALGISVTLFNRWLERYPEFAKAVEDGEDLSFGYWEDIGKKLAEGGNASVWALIMANRFGWRAKNEVSGEGGGPLRVEIVEVGK